MTESSINVYLVSLKHAIERRDVISRQFSKSFSSFNVIDAVDGSKLSAKTYFSYLSNYYLRTKKIITPSETGCALSHKKVLEKFLLSNATHAIILEDDVIGSDKLLEEAKSLICKIPDNGVLSLGCQEGLRSTRWHYGKRLQDTKVYRLCKFSCKYFYRSCAYIVTKKSARVILDRLNDGTLADEWTYLLNEDIDMYFVKLFEHPSDLKDSLIEPERALFNFKRKLWIGRLWDLQFYIRNITTIFFVAIALLTGHRKI